MHQVDHIFAISSKSDFEQLALSTFNYQYEHNIVYRNYCDLLHVDPERVDRLVQIPFLPIQFFKTHPIKTSTFEAQETFYSSGTTGQERSKHYVKDLSLYEQSFNRCFSHFYGNLKDYCILGLLPSYLERDGSSLVHMVNQFIRESAHPNSGFYLNNMDKLVEVIHQLEAKGQPTLLIGVSFALLDMAERYELNLKHTIVMETGGMKGRRKELTRAELHQQLKEKFNLSVIHSEYGMTELLSQAYSKGDGIFATPPWMEIMIREVNDPLALITTQRTGGINVVDLANIHSCSFIATQDLGRKLGDNKIEVLGRYDNSDVRGCNLLV